MTGSEKKGKGKGKTKQKTVLIFGENENDTRVIAALLRALWPEATWRLQSLKRPPLLIKDAKPGDVPSRVERIAAVIRAAAVSADVIAIFAHEDCDAVEDAHIALDAKIRQAFATAGHSVEPAVPAWEMETWLMQWPDAFSHHVAAWRSIQRYTGTNVGLIVDAKQALTRALRPNAKVRDYRESDAPILAEIVATNGWARSPKARSASYTMFVAAADAVWAAHAPT